MESTISVDGRGSIHLVPDVTRLEVCVESVFATYEDAYKQARENSKWMGQLISKLLTTIFIQWKNSWTKY